MKRVEPTVSSSTIFVILTLPILHCALRTETTGIDAGAEDERGAYQSLITLLSRVLLQLAVEFDASDFEVLLY